MTKELRFAGTGGQGLILAAIIYAEAALNEGHRVLQSQSYGPESRGGASKADCIISDTEIDYPKVYLADFLLAMSQKAYDKYKSDVKKGAVILFDSTYVEAEKREENVVYFSAPISKTVRDKIGKELASNIAALGTISVVYPLISEETLLNAILNRVPKATIELNKSAFDIGKQLGKEILEAKGSIEFVF
ncbi:2-oxoglutarate synthase [Thermodesulfobium narugense DSM 14796]|uniref:2-oxoglutarate synthase n=1 Tax=Thermodesulfobium narugense DSM 14796 TaxID=747365 RepID=M1E819_9BACT|nr:2-oxoacid:acceptor oxidoreductase family protein [Thermodesulfobium narugense]AEE14715.1 2-oxoglutarate synthase [Thermodesulfobium narugense DSM 14796]